MNSIIKQQFLLNRIICYILAGFTVLANQLGLDFVTLLCLFALGYELADGIKIHRAAKRVQEKGL